MNVPISLILIFALGSIGIYGFIIGGWASESKYSILGSMRTCAQLVSYEVSLALSRARRRADGPVAEPAGDRRQAAGDASGSSSRSSSGSCVFLLGGVAETSRPPFDLPEADTELVAGYHTEYSGMRWGIFQAAEYINMLVLSRPLRDALLRRLPLPVGAVARQVRPDLVRAEAVHARRSLFIWLRASQPRLRYDQLMRFGWKVLLPVATVNALVTAFLVVARHQ